MSQPPFQDLFPPQESDNSIASDTSKLDQDSSSVSEPPSSKKEEGDPAQTESGSPSTPSWYSSSKGILVSVLKWGTALIGCGGLAALALLLFTGYVVLTPIGDKVAPQTIVITKGTSVSGIANILDEKNITINPLFFRITARFVADDRLHAGEYQFLPTQNLVDIAIMMRDGLSVVRRFTVPEGLTSAEIVALLKNDPALSGDVDKTPDEGRLWPETYHYSYGDTRADMIARMRTAAREQLETLWASRDPEVPLSSKNEALTMASLIEKETGKKAEERARVAGVFYNRLKIGMRLQSDPTVIYALTQGDKPLARELTHADLDYNSPYNTYVHAGLPPGPICNPGKASLMAALHPEKNDFYYFVADGTGGHAFAKDLPDHNKNVNKWLKLSHP